jgi:hypothetical protein
MQLLNNLKNYEVDKTKNDQANRAKKKLGAIEKEFGCLGAELAALIKGKSAAAAGLYQWASATIRCFDIFKEVEPKKRKAAEMKRLND